MLCIGRVGVDHYPEQINVPLADVSRFSSAIGGTATNVAVAAARLGHRTAIVTKVGDDPFGLYVRQALGKFGVDSRGVSTHPDLPTPVVFAELNPASDPTILFYRQPSAPDEHLTIADIDLDLVRRVPVLWIPGSRMAFEQSAEMVIQVLEHRERLEHTVLDLDYRPMFWDSEKDAARGIGSLLSRVTVAVGNLEECRISVGTADPHEAAQRLLDLGVKIAIVKMGGDGVLAVDSHGNSAVVESSPVEVVCGLGSGDAFGGALVHGLLKGWASQPGGLERLMSYANAAGAIVASRLLCSDAMPTVDEVETMLETGIPPDASR
ncbi:MAG: 5-dehydro-2-deoxygluconokinase [Acidimicrobiales bacterium]